MRLWWVGFTALFGPPSRLEQHEKLARCPAVALSSLPWASALSTSHDTLSPQTSCRRYEAVVVAGVPHFAMLFPRLSGVGGGVKFVKSRVSRPNGLRGDRESLIVVVF